MIRKRPFKPRSRGWIRVKFKNNDNYYLHESECPRHSGNRDDTSVRVFVLVKYGNGDKCYIRTGYTDWDGDGFYWNIDKCSNTLVTVIAYRYTLNGYSCL